jgi:uncharacterized membrane protein
VYGLGFSPSFVVPCPYIPPPFPCLQPTSPPLTKTTTPQSQQATAAAQQQEQQHQLHQQQEQQEEEQRRARLSRVLWAFAVYDPAIKYCQGMNWVRVLCAVVSKRESVCVRVCVCAVVCCAVLFVVLCWGYMS